MTSNISRALNKKLQRPYQLIGSDKVEVDGEIKPLSDFDISTELSEVDLIRKQQLVIAERNRRLALGFMYDFGDARGVHLFGTTKADIEGWDEVSKAAQALINLNQPNATISIVTETGAVDITALEWQMVIAYSAQVRQPIWAKSFTLQAMNPIPENYADDSYWV